MSKKETAVAKTLPKEVQKPNYNSAEGLIAQAIQSGASIEMMKELMTMRREFKEEFAKEQFIAAMAKFQMECPVIVKKKIVKDKFGKEIYRYAPLDDIVAQVKKALGENNLAYDFDEEKDKEFATAICIITHIAGYTKKSSFKVEIGTESFMTSTQKYGARMTFAKRYAFCNALGILTGDEDTDAQDDKEEKPEVFNAHETAKQFGGTVVPNEPPKFTTTAKPAAINGTITRGSQTCPFCGITHDGTYPKCRTCWKKEKDGAKLAPMQKTKTLVNPDEVPFKS